MAYREITGSILGIGGNAAYAGKPVRFVLNPGGFDLSATYPEQSVSFTLDENSEIPAGSQLWTNAEGFDAHYECILPNGDTFEFDLPDGVGSIALETLRAAGVSSSNNSLISLIEARSVLYSGAQSLSAAEKAQAMANARPYLIYLALLTQTGSNAPTATVLENTLGGTPTFARTTNGVYSINLAGAFTDNKTFFAPGTAYGIFSVRWSTVGSLVMITQNIVGGAQADGLLTKTPLEIRVYL